LYAKADQSGQATVSGIARLFEGRSESTNDFEDETLISFTVPPMGKVTKSFHVLNAAEHSFGIDPDEATFAVTIRNQTAGIQLTAGGNVAAALPRQDQWCWCHRCMGLWFAGGDSNGRCPAGGGHRADGSGNYALVDSVSYPGGQPNWRWCHRCTGLWFSGYTGTGFFGSCPAGGGHSSAGSGNYVLALAVDSPGQHGWRWCDPCMGLWFAETGSGGRCPRNGNAHSQVDSGDYALAGL
jgi:hypothetical protein